MAWSRLKARWCELLAPCLVGRLDVHLAGYRRAYEGRGRAWFTFDGREIASFCDFDFANAWRDQSRRENETGQQFSNTTYAAVVASGHRNKGDVMTALAACIGQPIDQRLAASDLLIRALTMVDRRLGKRRLAVFDLTAEVPFVRLMHRLRTQTASIKSR